MESKVGRGIGKTISLAQHICDVINEGKMCSVIAEGRFTEVAPIVRCKDCKHRPKVVEEKDSVGVMETYYEFPDDSKCPCQNTNDQYYSWCPDDDWFCADGERAVT